MLLKFSRFGIELKTVRIFLPVFLFKKKITKINKIIKIQKNIIIYIANIKKPE
jgi:hypothetical protein